MPLTEKNIYTVKPVRMKSQGTRYKFSFRQISLLALYCIFFIGNRKYYFQFKAQFRYIQDSFWQVLLHSIYYKISISVLILGILVVFKIIPVIFRVQYL